MFAEFTISEWLAQADLVQLGLWVIYGFIVLATALLGGFVTGFVSQKLALIFVGELSRKVVTRLRLAGGVVAGGVAALLVATGGFGIGSGPGQVGAPGAGTGKEVAQKEPSPSLSEPKAPAKPDAGGLTERAGGQTLLRVTVLGDGTQPPYQPVNRFFAFADDASPLALDVDAVMQRIEQLKKDGALREVELVVTPQSTSLQNLEVQRLRRAIQQAGLRLYEPPHPNK